MLTMTSLWAAILVAAVLTWIASALIWTVLPWHKNDFLRLPDEDSALASLRPQDLRPGQYHFPYMASPGDVKEPAVREKLEAGPAGFMTVLPRGVPNMGKSMALSLLFNVFVSAAVAYVASRTIAAGADYLEVFRVTGTVAWLAYGMAVIPDAVWFGRPWSIVAKYILDAFIYGLLAAGAFGWLWPAG